MTDIEILQAEVRTLTQLVHNLATVNTVPTQPIDAEVQSFQEDIEQMDKDLIQNESTNGYEQTTRNRQILGNLSRAVKLATGEGQKKAVLNSGSLIFLAMAKKLASR